MKVGFKDINGRFLGLVVFETQEVILGADDAEADIVLSFQDPTSFDRLRHELEYRVLDPTQIIGMLVRSLLITSTELRAKRLERL